MIPEEASDNVPITNVENGKSLRDNLRNVGDADVQNTAAKTVRRVPGCIIATGALLPPNERDELPWKNLNESFKDINDSAFASQSSDLFLSSSAGVSVISEGVNNSIGKLSSLLLYH